MSSETGVSGELFQALQIAKEAERKAEASYVDAAARAGSSLGSLPLECWYCLPTLDMVKDWVAQAKALPRVIEY
ncbi:MAG TPA: hypothetical protein EYP52_10595 [Anaerolineae bacterium]|nr:hypothetical protein [Anaerolineae bacterium]